MLHLHTEQLLREFLQRRRSTATKQLSKRLELGRVANALTGMRQKQNLQTDPTKKTLRVKKLQNAFGKGRGRKSFLEESN